MAGHALILAALLACLAALAALSRWAAAVALVRADLPLRRGRTDRDEPYAGSPWEVEATRLGSCSGWGGAR